MRRDEPYGRGCPPGCGGRVRDGFGRRTLAHGPVAPLAAPDRTAGAPGRHPPVGRSNCRSDGGSPCPGHPLDPSNERRASAGLLARGSSLGTRLPRFPQWLRRQWCRRVRISLAAHSCRDSCGFGTPSAPVPHSRFKPLSGHRRDLSKTGEPALDAPPLAERARAAKRFPTASGDRTGASTAAICQLYAKPRDRSRIATRHAPNRLPLRACRLSVRPDRTWGKR